MTKLVKIPTSSFSKVYEEGSDRKNRTVKQWIGFLNNGLTRKSFKKDLYSHLYLHGGAFIAHNNIDGFYEHYFYKCAKAEKLFAQHTNLSYRRTLFIMENFIDQAEGKEFIDNLFHEMSSYGIHKDVNETMRKVFMLYIRNTQEYLQSFNKKNAVAPITTPKGKVA